MRGAGCGVRVRGRAYAVWCAARGACAHVRETPCTCPSHVQPIARAAQNTLEKCYKFWLLICAVYYFIHEFFHRFRVLRDRGKL